MSRRRDIERRLAGLAEIGEIMNAMKNMALTETHRLAGRMSARQRYAESVTAAVARFLAYFPQAARPGPPAREVCLLIGSERGFCGDFNEALLRALNGMRWTGSPPALVAVGSRLANVLAGDERLLGRVAGASTLDEIDAVLLEVMEVLGRTRAAQALRVTVLHHDGELGRVLTTPLDPLGLPPHRPVRHGADLLLNLAPRAYFEKVTEHYLLASLTTLLHASLLAEHRRRARHMDQAVHRIEEKSRELALARNALRQEEITEEIEVIMMNVGIRGKSYPKVARTGTGRARNASA